MSKRAMSPVRDAANEPGISLAERAYKDLEDRIVTLQLKPGAVLSEQKLALELGIGRSPVREALQRLAYEGLVFIMPRRGVLVSEINVNKHYKLIEARREIERLLVRLACKSVSREECREFADIAREFEQCARDEDARVFMQIDSRFNKLVSNSANNEYAEKANQLMRGLTRRFWFKYCGLADLKKCARLHAKLARAISKEDADGAIDALQHLLDYIEELTLSTLNASKIR